MICTHCGATVPEGEDRCRKCLRKSGLAESAPPPPKDPGESVAPKSTVGRVLTAILAAVVIVIGYVVLRMALELFVPPPSMPIARPPPSADLGLRDMESVQVRTSRVPAKGDLFDVNITADAGDFERTLGKLRAHVVAVTVFEVKNDETASGTIRAVFPRRFDTPDHAKRLEEEEKNIRTGLVKVGATTPKGAAIRVTLEFGAP